MADPKFGRTGGYENYRSWRPPQGPGMENAAENFVRLMPHGTPAQVIERYDQIAHDLGPQELLVQFHFGNMSRREADRYLRCFAAKCLPELQRLTAAAGVSTAGSLA